MKEYLTEELPKTESSKVDEAISQFKVGRVKLIELIQLDNAKLKESGKRIPRVSLAGLTVEELVETRRLQLVQFQSVDVLNKNKKETSIE